MAMSKADLEKMKAAALAPDPDDVVEPDEIDSDEEDFPEVYTYVIDYSDHLGICREAAFTVANQKTARAEFRKDGDKERRDKAGNVYPKWLIRSIRRRG